MWFLLSSVLGIVIGQMPEVEVVTKRQRFPAVLCVTNIDTKSPELRFPCRAPRFDELRVVPTSLEDGTQFVALGGIAKATVAKVRIPWGRLCLTMRSAAEILQQPAAYEVRRNIDGQSEVVQSSSERCMSGYLVTLKPGDRVRVTLDTVDLPYGTATGYLNEDGVPMGLVLQRPALHQGILLPPGKWGKGRYPNAALTIAANGRKMTLKLLAESLSNAIRNEQNLVVGGDHVWAILHAEGDELTALRKLDREVLEKRILSKLDTLLSLLEQQRYYYDLENVTFLKQNGMLPATMPDAAVEMSYAEMLRLAREELPRWRERQKKQQ